MDAYSEVPVLYGRSESGPVDDRGFGLGHNCAVFVVGDDEVVGRVSEAFTSWKESEQERRGDDAVPLRAFVLPCQQVI